MASPKHSFFEDDTVRKSLSPREFAELGGSKLVYIRTVIARDVMEDLRDEEGDIDFDVQDGDTLYSVHSAEGERIALVGDRELAFAAARQYEMNPVSVH